MMMMMMMSRTGVLKTLQSLEKANIGIETACIEIALMMMMMMMMSRRSFEKPYKTLET